MQALSRIPYGFRKIRHAVSFKVRAIVGGQAPGAAHSGREAGAVTAEFAVAFPAVILVLALCLGAASVGIAQSRLEESARVAARSFARGDSVSAVQSEVARIDPAITVHTETGEEPGARRVRVRVERAAPGILGSTTGWRLHATATTRLEESPDHADS